MALLKLEVQHIFSHVFGRNATVNPINVDELPNKTGDYMYYETQHCCVVHSLPFLSSHGFQTNACDNSRRASLFLDPPSGTNKIVCCVIINWQIPIAQ